MSNKKQAKILVKAFKLLHEKTKDKSRLGCKKAAVEMMENLAAEAFSLRNLGFMLNDSGRLVKIKRVPFENE